MSPSFNNNTSTICDAQVQTSTEILFLDVHPWGRLQMLARMWKTEFMGRDNTRNDAKFNFSDFPSCRQSVISFFQNFTFIENSRKFCFMKGVNGRKGKSVLDVRAWLSKITFYQQFPNPIYRNQPQAMNPSICFKFCRQELKICALMHKFGIFAVSPLEKQLC